MSHEYERPPAASGLRLHLNENTAGCSPRVIAALRRIGREDAAFYPEYDRAVGACAARYGVSAENVVLTNGLDEGILLVAIDAARRSAGGDRFEALIVQPAFDMYAACVDAVGGRIVHIPPGPGFEFPLDAAIAAIRPNTRAIFLTNPNNPTGLSIPPETVLAVARAAPQAIVLLDEAYADFAGRTMIAEAVSGRIPNLVIGRTFAKAYGLAGLRAGALIAAAGTLAPMSRAVPPYTLNVYAAAALPAAFEDVEYYDWYLSQVEESKRLVYAALQAGGIRYWKSDGNFVLAHFGDRLAEVIAGLASRGVAIRDRSHDPGCVGCARMTAGVVEHTRQLVSALQEVLCAAP